MLMPVTVGANYAKNTSIEIQSFWNSVDNVALNLRISVNTAFCDVTIRGLTGVTSINADITLYRVKLNGGLQIVQIWSQQGSRNLTFSGSAQITGGGTYRLSVSARVIRNGVTENVNDWIERRL